MSDERNGVTFRYSSKEVVDILQRRSRNHAATVEKLKKKLEALPSRDEVEEVAYEESMYPIPPSGIGNVKKQFRARMKHHAGLAAAFSDLAKHVVPDQEFLLTTEMHGLSLLGPGFSGFGSGLGVAMHAFSDPDDVEAF